MTVNGGSRRGFRGLAQPPLPPPPPHTHTPLLSTGSTQKDPISCLTVNSLKIMTVNGGSRRGFRGLSPPTHTHSHRFLVLVQPRKTRPCLTERLLMGRKESNIQTKKNTHRSQFFKYPIKMKLFGLTATKLFHFHGLFKKHGIKSAQQTPTHLNI